MYRPANTVVAVAGDLEHDEAVVSWRPRRSGAASVARPAFEPAPALPAGPRVLTGRSATRRQAQLCDLAAGAPAGPPRRLEPRAAQRRAGRRDVESPVPRRARGEGACLRRELRGRGIRGRRRARDLGRRGSRSAARRRSRRSLAELARLIDEAVPAEELAKAKAYLVGRPGAAHGRHAPPRLVDRRAGGAPRSCLHARRGDRRPSRRCGRRTSPALAARAVPRRRAAHGGGRSRQAPPRAGPAPAAVAMTEDEPGPGMGEEPATAGPQAPGDAPAAGRLDPESESDVGHVHGTGAGPGAGAEVASTPTTRPARRSRAARRSDPGSAAAAGATADVVSDALVPEGTPGIEEPGPEAVETGAGPEPEASVSAAEGLSPRPAGPTVEPNERPVAPGEPDDPGPSHEPAPAHPTSPTSPPHPTSPTSLPHPTSPTSLPHPTSPTSLPHPTSPTSPTSLLRPAARSGSASHASTSARARSPSLVPSSRRLPGTVLSTRTRSSTSRRSGGGPGISREPARLPRRRSRRASRIPSLWSSRLRRWRPSDGRARRGGSRVVRCSSSRARSTPSSPACREVRSGLPMSPSRRSRCSRSRRDRLSRACPAKAHAGPGQVRPEQRRRRRQRPPRHLPGVAARSRPAILPRRPCVSAWRSASIRGSPRACWGRSASVRRTRPWRWWRATPCACSAGRPRPSRHTTWLAAVATPSAQPRPEPPPGPDDESA